MNLIAIEDLHKKFTSEPEYSLEYTIEFFAKNGSTFNNLKTFENNDELNIYIELAWHYLHVLFQKNMFGETASKSIDCLKIIDSEAARLNLSVTGNEWYLGIILFKGMATYRLHKYKSSTRIFKQLTDLNTQSENFKNWLKYSKFQEQKRISKAITIACVILFLGEWVFEKYISYSVRMSILGIATTGIIAALFYDFYIKRIFKNAQSK